MKPENAVEVENLWKRYFVGSAPVGNQQSLTKTILHNLMSPFQRLRWAWQGKSAFASDSEMWALQDVSFEVKKGDIIGIIGSNGSGKSTLLKILSRITYPTKGEVRLQGTVGSLLEVGTGFHPELTGRENIYMNGAVLGMSRDDINKRFDEIIAFSGIGKFLDTPVKRYSSGMRVRLGFSVAAHFNPEVLLVDEVLSVGDAEFQKRGLGKMASVAQQGRTVIMVSHNLSAILSHSRQVMWLQKGNLMAVGEPNQVVSTYLSENTGDAGVSEGEKLFSDLPDTGHPFKLRAFRTLDQNGNVCSQFLTTAPVILEMEFELSLPIPFLRLGFEMKTSQETTIFRTYHNDRDETFQFNPDNLDHVYKIRAVLPSNLLNKGTYYIDPLVVIHRGDWLVNNRRGLAINMVFDIPNKEYVVKQRPGIIAPVFDWHTVEDKEKTTYDS